jgi:hypothetical protein
MQPVHKYNIFKRKRDKEFQKFALNLCSYSFDTPNDCRISFVITFSRTWNPCTKFTSNEDFQGASVWRQYRKATWISVRLFDVLEYNYRNLSILHSKY